MTHGYGRTRHLVGEGLRRRAARRALVLRRVTPRAVHQVAQRHRPRLGGPLRHIRVLQLRPQGLHVVGRLQLRLVVRGHVVRHRGGGLQPAHHPRHELHVLELPDIADRPVPERQVHRRRGGPEWLGLRRPKVRRRDLQGDGQRILQVRPKGPVRQHELARPARPRAGLPAAIQPHRRRGGRGRAGHQLRRARVDAPR